MTFEVIYNKSLKIFSKLYVGVKPANGDATPLAFATPYEETAAGKKRQDTVMSWVGTHQYDYATRKNIKTTPDIRIVDNVPMYGFTITDDVKRIYWGGGNVVWRLEHPLGWEIEIQSNNLMALIQGVGIEAGGIVPGECVLARDGAHNVLLPVSSEEYKNAIKAAESAKAPGKVPMKDRVIGRTYRLASGEYGQYMGKMFIREGDVEYRPDHSHLGFTAKGKNYSISADCRNDFVYNSQDMETYEVVFIPNDAEKSIAGDIQEGSSKLFKSAPLIDELDKETLTSEEAEIIVNANSMSWASSSKSSKPVYASLTADCNIQFVPVCVSKEKFELARAATLKIANDLKSQYEFQLKNPQPNFINTPPKYTIAGLLNPYRWNLNYFLDGLIYSSIEAVYFKDEPSNYLNQFDRSKKEIAIIAGRSVIEKNSVKKYSPTSYSVASLIRQNDHSDSTIMSRVIHGYESIEELTNALDADFELGRFVTIVAERKT